MATTIGFRPTPEDQRVIDAAQRDGEPTSEVLRRALRLLGRETWVAQARADAERLADENLADEPDAW